ncbi:MAG: hypothetical protein J0I80_00795 [Sphingomonas sp.]|nr:hypothetical protein [Sphingomonas sp.]
MITRTAIFEGRFSGDNEARFFAGVEERLAPLWRKFPHAVDVRWFRMDTADADARPIVMIQQIDYPSHEALAEAVASPIRDQSRAVTLDLMTLLDGSFYHFISEGGRR